VWQVRLGAAAETDFAGILRYTRDTFGAKQADVYKETLTDALAALHGGPNLQGSVARDEIRQGLRTLHVARRGRRGRHFVMYRVVSDSAGEDVIEVVRILHDGMDLARHIPPEA
jgi:toxin ParE1/3/4